MDQEVNYSSPVKFLVGIHTTLQPQSYSGFRSEGGDGYVTRRSINKAMQQEEVLMIMKKLAKRVLESQKGCEFRKIE